MLPITRINLMGLLHINQQSLAHLILYQNYVQTLQTLNFKIILTVSSECAKNT